MVPVQDSWITEDRLPHARKELRHLLSQIDPSDLRLPEILGLLVVLGPVAARVQAAPRPALSVIPGVDDSPTQLG